MTFETLLLLTAAGLAGPLLAGFKRFSVPLVVGEIFAGILIGSSGLGWINAQEPTLVFLSEVGFAMLMFLVGTHLPLRDPNLHKALRRGGIASGLSFALAVPVALGVAYLTGINHPLVFVLLFANSSAAVVMPIVHERKLDGPTVLLTTTWIALADMVTIVALPLALNPSHVASIVAGALVITAMALVAFFGLKVFRRSGVGDHYRQESKERGWALDLRLSLIILFALSWLAVKFGTSILVAGFAAGAVVALVGEPKRLTKQLIGLAEGFFVPLFFVALGAKLNVSALVHSATDIELMLLLALATVVVHLAVAKIVKLPVASALTATAQNGLPVAVVALGLTNGLLEPGQGAAIIAASLLTLLTCSLGTSKLASAARSDTARGGTESGYRFPVIKLPPEDEDEDEADDES